MATEGDGDLGVDVLVIGGGIQALYIAHALHPHLTVCVVSEPNVPIESLDASGYFSAGYDGDDVSRIQPARRATGYWGLWAESTGVPHATEPWIVVPIDDEARHTQIWRDAALAARADEELPAIFAGGALEGLAKYRALNDVVINPSKVMAELRRGIEDRIIEATVVKFEVISESAIDYVEVQLPDGSLLPITPRFVVMVADVANGALLQRLTAAFKDRPKRREAIEAMRHCQAVRRRTTVVARGELPAVAGRFDGIEIVSYDAADGWDTVWVVTAPIDDSQTVLGPEDMRFSPKLDHKIVADTLDRIFAMSPELEARADELQWGAYVARKTEHPMMAVPDISAIAQPSPARLETLELDSFIAAWPSHLPYSMIVGDVVAERVRQALGDSAQDGGGIDPGILAAPSAQSQLTRWERDDFRWSEWAGFCEQVGYTRP